MASTAPLKNARLPLPEARLYRARVDAVQIGFEAQYTAEQNCEVLVRIYQRARVKEA